MFRTKDTKNTKRRFFYFLPLRPLCPLCETFLLLFLATGPAVAEQVLRIGNGAEPESLDPHKAQTVPAINIAHDLFEGLVGFSPHGELQPGAAERWEVSADGLEYVFHLRPQAKWSSGEALVAEDFAAGLRRSLDPATGSVYGSVFAAILNADAVLAGQLPVSSLGLEALDPHTLRIRLATPAPHLPGLLTLPAAAPLHRASFEQHRSQVARPGRLVSNGAYVLDDWVLQSHLRLRRNPHYWNDAATRIDAVYFHPTEDRDTELKRYRAGELDITYGLPLARVGWLRQNLPQDLRVGSFLGTFYVGFNCTQPPFRDQPDLRQALSLVIDRDLIARKVLSGLGQPAQGWVPAEIAGYTAQQAEGTQWPHEQRMAEARRLYAAAGYSPKHPLEIELRYSTGPDNKRMATVLAAMWKQTLGVRTRLINEEYRVLLGHLKQRRVTQAFLWSWIGDYNDAASFADVLHSTSRANYPGWSSARYDALLHDAARQADAGQRRNTLEQAERVLLEDLPLAPIYFYASKHLVKPHIAGWEHNVLDYHYTKDLRLLPH